jgi:hypothetical protein
MGTILKNIVQFTGLVIGVPTSLPHRLNVNGRPVMPKIGGGDAGGFTITADTVDVTATRLAGADPDVNVYVEYWHTLESVTPLIPPPGQLIGLTPLFFAGGSGGSGAASQLLSIYGDGSYGDYVTAGDETWTSLAGAPGAPAVPVGSPLPFAFFDNLTISPGNSIAVGGFTDQATQRAVVIFVKDTLTIGAGSRIHVNGGNGPGTIGSGLGRNAIIGSQNGADGGAGRPGFDPGAGNPGGGGTDRPALSSAARIGGTGGNGGIGGAVLGGAGGVDAADASWPYSLAMAITLGALDFVIGGGNGGGGGGNNGSSGGGAGGGGAGTLVIFAKTIVVADPGCLQAIGGVGGDGTSTENVAGGGGGGGTGGAIVIVTENTTLLGVTDVSGGAGGTGAGLPQDDGTAGGPGEAIAFNPMLAAQIPV